MKWYDPQIVSPIDKMSKRVHNILTYKSASGIVLFVSVIIAIIWANSTFRESYHAIFHKYIVLQFGSATFKQSLLHFINDGLMAVFFFMIGLEIKREMISGDLSSPRKAALPIAAAIGGMILPAVIYAIINRNSGAPEGWGVPMATDIAFSLGVLSLLGKKVPIALKIFLTALAIVDDLGAVLVIAFFYTSEISFSNLLVGAVILTFLALYNIFGGRKTTVYAIVGIGGLWLAFMLSGVHATIAGVLAAFTIPARSKIDKNTFVNVLCQLTDRFRISTDNDSRLATHEQQHIIEEIKQVSYDVETPLQKLEHAISPLVAFLILPIFAIANAGIEIESDFLQMLIHPVSLGIALGLIIGKFSGVFLFSKLAVRLKIAELPEGLTWKHIAGIGFFAGIGFTMSLFITDLAFENEEYIAIAKASIIVASVLSGLIGFVILNSIKAKA
ncbi:MAG: Na+/H+ antiporter NhaA [Bacteroidetes bacterium]|nr:Na+/H+ antiporter NhaA [Cytophagia bacterium]MBT7038738.1 Na+/H+ antiporter NhaA [Bacteroidota bacterium]